MKLLYVWIHKFRNIQQQAIVISPEFRFTVKAKEDNPVFIDAKDKCRVFPMGNAQKSVKKMYQLELDWERDTKKNSEKEGKGASSEKLSPISSLTTLVGENATGKSSLLECLHSKHTNNEERFFLFIFFDDKTGTLVVRSCGLLLTGEDFSVTSNRTNKNFIEYRLIVPSDKEQNKTEDDFTRIISIHSSYKNVDSGTHKVLGLLADTINLIELQTRNSFLFMFEYFCFLPQLGGKENKFTLTLLDDKDAEPFTKGTARPHDYKNLFIYKAHQLLFEDLRNFLYRGKEEFSLSGQRTDSYCGEIMEKEYHKSGEIVSFTNLFSWPSPSGVTLISWKKEPISKEKVENVFAFFRNATYVRSGRIEYDMYLDNLQRFLNSLEMLPEEYFTAFYKIELPFDSTFRDMVSTLSLLKLTKGIFIISESHFFGNSVLYTHDCDIVV